MTGTLGVTSRIIRCGPFDAVLLCGQLDFPDVSVCANGFFKGDRVAGLNGKTIFDLTNIDAFITGFLSGCPLRPVPRSRSRRTTGARKRRPDRRTAQCFMKRDRDQLSRRRRPATNPSPAAPIAPASGIGTSVVFWFEKSSQPSTPLHWLSIPFAS